MEAKVILVIRWIARILGIALCIFWGIFFVEHLLEWFIKPLPQTPPLEIWIDQLLHLAMLAGFLIALRKEGIGGIMIIISTLLFFPRKSASGYIPITILPGIMFLFCWWRTFKIGRKIVS